MKIDTSLSYLTSQLIWTWICRVNLTGQPHWFCEVLNLARVSPKSIGNVRDEQMHKRRLKCSQLTKKCGMGRNKSELLEWQQKEGLNKRLGMKRRWRQVLKRGHEEKRWTEAGMNWSERGWRWDRGRDWKEGSKWKTDEQEAAAGKAWGRMGSWR